MEMVKDLVHKFRSRPNYTTDELDNECEKIICNFLRKKYGTPSFPVSTEDLTVLVEQETESLDLYADLTSPDEEVEGVTIFLPNKKPQVQISQLLSENPSYENRLRTTLAHELGHVKLHNYLIQIKSKFSHQCKRSDIQGNLRDWMEWQAGYACGAILAPKTELLSLVKTFLKNSSVATAFELDLFGRGNLIATVAKKFSISNQAAEVRLKQKRVL